MNIIEKYEIYNKQDYLDEKIKLNHRNQRYLIIIQIK